MDDGIIPERRALHVTKLTGNQLWSGRALLVSDIQRTHSHSAQLYDVIQRFNLFSRDSG